MLLKRKDVPPPTSNGAKRETSDRHFEPYPQHTGIKAAPTWHAADKAAHVAALAFQLLCRTNAFARSDNSPPISGTASSIIIDWTVEGVFMRDAQYQRAAAP